MNLTGMHIEVAKNTFTVGSSLEPSENMLSCSDIISKDITQHVENILPVVTAQLEQGTKQKRRRRKIKTMECSTQTDVDKTVKLNCSSTEIAEFGTQTEKGVHKTKKREKENQSKKQEFCEKLEKIIRKIETKHRSI